MQRRAGDSESDCPLSDWLWEGGSQGQGQGSRSKTRADSQRGREGREAYRRYPVPKVLQAEPLHHKVLLGGNQPDHKHSLTLTNTHSHSHSLTTLVTNNKSS